MIAFDISIDGQKLCTAGVDGAGVLSAIATWVRRASRDASSGAPVPSQFDEHLTLHVGGMEHDADGAGVHVTWVDRSLSVGQQITLAVVDVDSVDAPSSQQREDPARAE